MMQGMTALHALQRLLNLHQSHTVFILLCKLSSLASATPRPPLSPYLKPLPAPPIDAEVLDLQAQVRSYHHRSA